MRHHFGIATVVAAAGLTSPALAQDSVSSSLGGLPGDALNPWNEGCAAYVIDLAPITTSWGNTFGVAPILKTSRMSTANFNAISSPVTISPDVLRNSPFTRPSYSVWDTPGAGVGVNNSIPGSVNAPAQGSRFGVAISEFGTTDGGVNYNGIIGAMVGFEPANPNRLYVDRRVAALNTSGPTTGDSSQLGGVSIDANGNLYYRADDFGSTGPDQVSGNNLFRTRLIDRDCGSNNVISTGGTIDGTDWLLNGSGTTHAVPSSVPASVAGGNGLIADPNFDGAYVYGSTPGGLTATTGHLDPATSDGTRGTFGGTAHQALGSGVYTFALSAQNTTDGNNTVVNLWSVDASGAVVDRKGFEVPLSITDNDSGFTINYLPGVYESRHHTGPTAFRGGVGTVAVGSDQEGRTLIAKTISENGLNGDVTHQIVVGRYDDPNGPVEWTMAAYLDIFGLFSQDEGKAIYDGDGNVIGQLVTLQRVAQTLTGPGMSAPAFDSAGNVWFLSSIEQFDVFPGGQSRTTSALLRAVYDPDTFSYRLEQVLDVGTIVEGQNSGVDYRIAFLGTSTGGNTPAPNSLWSTAVADGAWNGTDTTGLDPADPITNGGVVLSTSVIYDSNDDGVFNNPTSTFFDPAFPADEAYSLAFYIGYYADEADCLADFNNDGMVNFFDVSSFITAFNNQDPASDVNNDGMYNFFDVSTFITAFNQGCP